MFEGQNCISFKFVLQSWIYVSKVVEAKDSHWQACHLFNVDTRGDGNVKLYPSTVARSLFQSTAWQYTHGVDQLCLFL